MVFVFEWAQLIYVSIVAITLIIAVCFIFSSFLVAPRVASPCG